MCVFIDIISSNIYFNVYSFAPWLDYLVNLNFYSQTMKKYRELLKKSPVIMGMDIPEIMGSPEGEVAL